MNFFDIFINNGRICMGFEADRVEKSTKTCLSNKIFQKMSDKKVIAKQRVKILLDLQFFLNDFYF